MSELVTEEIAFWTLRGSNRQLVNVLANNHWLNDKLEFI